MGLWTRGSKRDPEKFLALLSRPAYFLGLSVRGVSKASMIVSRLPTTGVSKWSAPTLEGDVVFSGRRRKPVRFIPKTVRFKAKTVRSRAKKAPGFCRRLLGTLAAAFSLGKLFFLISVRFFFFFLFLVRQHGVIRASEDLFEEAAKDGGNF